MTQNIEYSAQWQGNNEFYSHLYKIADKMFMAKIEAMINVKKDTETTILFMQVWYECIKSIYFTVRYALKEDEAEKIQGYIDLIDEKCEEKDFAHANLYENGKATEIRNILETSEYELWYYLGKYDFLVKKTSKKIYDSVEEQIEDENL
jgi:hypothetical protein